MSWVQGKGASDEKALMQHSNYRNVTLKKKKLSRMQLIFRIEAILVAN